ncbi:hypothetical protein E8E13_002346 [Curvularia kusanoi]|uniref:Uncharacterized protein n=1 Tax=Curvularia kusanoi TaxID=90978 RepID=A0A9P4WDU0_CURKU|nr:hypothetical protein E8E13_002346 [Curvularia kusanoi]
MPPRGVVTARTNLVMHDVNMSNVEMDVEDRKSIRLQLRNVDMTNVTIGKISKVNMRKVKLNNVRLGGKSLIALKDNEDARLQQPELLYNNIISPYPWFRIYVGQIREVASTGNTGEANRYEPSGRETNNSDTENDNLNNARDCWLSFPLGDGAFYHQSAGGIRSDDKDRNWQERVIEGTVPQCLQRTLSLEENAERLLLKTFGPQTGIGSCFASPNAGIILRAQQGHVVREKEKNGPRQTDDEVNGHAKGMPANSLPSHYSEFEVGSSASYPWWYGWLDDDNSPPWLAEEREWFNFKAPCEEANVAGVQRAFSRNFGTFNHPSLGLIKNMRSFGELCAKDDPRKVFDFFEWVEWWAEDRRRGIADKEVRQERLHEHKLPFLELDVQIVGSTRLQELESWADWTAQLPSLG